LEVGGAVNRIGGLDEVKNIQLQERGGGAI
jgi:hypothetical protein